MRGVAAGLPAEVHGRIPQVVIREGGGWLRSGLEALVARPGFEEHAVHGEVLGRDEVRLAGLGEDGGEEGLGNVALKEPAPVLGEHGRIPDGIVHGQAHEPAEHEGVVELLQELALAPDAVEGLKQDRAEELLRGDRGVAAVGVEQAEAGREGLQRLIHHRPDRAEEMVLGNPLLRPEVAPHVVLVSILSAYLAPPLHVR